MPYKVLIADRGEAAVRIARTLRADGYIPLGIYTKEDGESLHRRFVAGDKEVSSYLDVKDIVRAAAELGADAVHPGYSLLGENPDFASEVLRKGMTFIGPPPSIIKTARDKVSSKTYAEKMGIPTLPWTEVERPEDVLEFASAHGYPVIIKPATGSRGVGLRIAWSEREVEAAFESARKEAEKAFKNPRLYVEVYLPRAKHIEVQVLGDGSHVVHLGERECSLQRGFQKIVEEAPSPSLTPEERNKIYEYAVLLAERLKYVGIGAIEFLFDVEKREFYFIEVNVGLQPEHSVTEMITGVDVVKKQVEIALFKTLDLKQSDVGFRGHAIEVKIYAENPYTGEPSLGRVTAYSEPAGPGIRVDPGIAAGSNVVEASGSFVSKLVAWGPDRPAAIKRLENALREYVIEGVVTNLRLLKHVISSPEFLQATYTTRFLEERAGYFREKLAEEALLHSVVAVALVEAGDESAKTLLHKPGLVERVLESERARSLKRSAWYYYMALKSSIERAKFRSRRAGLRREEGKEARGR
ncbi:MAG: biotin carboxylase N-terminal domain-containing protein [Desulfurococcaceae archaeon]